MPKCKTAPRTFSAIGVPSVDREKRRINGFAVATKGPAVGHGEKLDETTLQQLVALGNAGTIRCRLDHPDEDGSVSNELSKLIGYAINFRVEGDVVRADCQVLSSAAAPAGDKLLALAAEAPQLFGASMVFDGKTEKGSVRVKTLFAVDFVDVPAANPTGLFAAGSKEDEVADEDKNEHKPLKAEMGEDGKCYVEVGGEKMEVELPKKESAEEEEEADEDEEDEGEKKLSAGTKVVNLESAREEGRKTERAYAKAFSAAMTAAGLKDKDAEEFEKDFYGRDLKDVKFLAARCIGTRAKAVGESAGGEKGEGETKKSLSVKTDAVKRFASEVRVRRSWGVMSNDENSKEYKDGLDRYVAAEERWVKDQAAQPAK